MRFPVEVVPDRTELVIEVGDHVANLMHRLLHLREVVDHHRGDVRQLRHQPVHGAHRSDRAGQVISLDAHVLHPVLHQLHVLLLTDALHADQKRDRGVLDRRAVRTGRGLHAGDTLDAEDPLGEPVQHQEVGRVAQVVVGFDEEDLRAHPGQREVFGRSLQPGVGRNGLRDIAGVVVAGLVARQRGQPDEGQRQRRHQYRPGPADHHGADATPGADPHGSLGLEETEAAADGHDRRSEGERDGHPGQSAHPARHTHALEIGHAGERQAEHRAGDGQARAQHDGRRAVEHLVIGLFVGGAGGSGLLITADEEDRVVGARRHSQRDQQVGRERRQTDQLVVGQRSDDAACQPQLDEDHRQQQQHGRDRAVEEQQQHCDHHEGDHQHERHAALTGDVDVGGQWRRPGDMHPNPGWRR